MKQRVDTPYEPVIPRSECNAALKLAERMYENILRSGDVPEEVVAWTVRVSEESKKLRSKLRTDSTGKDSDAVGDAIVTALLPTFHHKSSQEEAGAALLSLIGVGSKYGWSSPKPEEVPEGCEPAPVAGG